MATDYTRWGGMIFEKLDRWTDSAIKMLPNLAVAVIVITVFFLLARLIKFLTFKFMLRISHTSALSGLLASLLAFIITTIGFFIALDVLKLEKAVTSLLAGAGIIGLALGFAFQDLTANFISGIFMTVKRPFEVGHQIETNGFIGNVEDIQLRSTLIRTLDGLHVILPNKEIFQKPIINHSLTPERRAEISFNIPAVNENTLKIEQLISQALNGMENLGRDQHPSVFFTTIDGANLKVTVTCWINNKDIITFQQTQDEVIRRITTVLRDNKMI